MAWSERYVRADAAGGGDGTTDAASGANGSWTLAEAIAAVTAGMRINVKAGTYANTTTTRTFNVSGTATAPIWWRGYNATPGDLDSDFATAKPSLTFTTGQFNVGGAHQWFSSLSIVGAQTTNGQLRTSTGACMRFRRCRFECTSANANGRAVSIATNNEIVFSECWFKATSSADILDGLTTGSVVTACVFEGGNHGVTLGASTSPGGIAGCIFRGQAGDAIRITSTGARIMISGCTIYGAGSDGVEITATLTVGVAIVGCIFSECGGYGINNSSGGNLNNVFRSHNLFHACTSGSESGIGDSPHFAGRTDSSSPFEAAASGDFTPVATSAAIGNGPPGVFEGL